MSPPRVDPAMMLVDGRTLSENFVILENVLGTTLPRIATLENRINDKFASYDTRLDSLETRLNRATQARRMLVPDGPPISHRGAGALAYDPVRPPASTTLFDFNGLEQQEATQTSVSLQAPAGAGSVVLTAADDNPFAMPPLPAAQVAASQDRQACTEPTHTHRCVSLVRKLINSFQHLSIACLHWA